MDNYAVFGSPIAHSLSPQIFNILFSFHGINSQYLRIHAESATEVFSAAADIGLKGFNVTAPLKQEIMDRLDGCDQASNEIGGVNCVLRRGEQWLGTNTDFLGVMSALQSHQVNVVGKTALILGAGGAARAAAYGLLKAGAARVILLNRTPENARPVAKQLGCEVVPPEERKSVLKDCEILISCVPDPRSLIDTSELEGFEVIFDADYRNGRLAAAGNDKKQKIIDGMDWLIGQALPCFQLYTGKSPKLSPFQVRGRIPPASTRKRPHIALIGFMGSGKSTVGKILAKKKGLTCIDTDIEIEKQAGLSIKEIFSLEGESGFRKREAAILITHITSAPAAVFSLGGGAVANLKNRELIRSHCRTVWLWSSLTSALERIDPRNRPLLDEQKQRSRAEKLLKDRIPFYAESADLVISTDSGDEYAAAQRIHNETN